ncbi:MAG: redoxin domain-containing protein [Leptospiraceae bacterium]|nr:redoxin domain-containing protein [Leptospiraceae bacterium]MCP5501559.1 redoxin domain-containing protein [Leptospiraceae bacterium]
MQKKKSTFAKKPEFKSFEGTVKAPAFPSGLKWVNTSKPLSLSELKGKVVILDFWTYCCINCLHVIPDLKKLEEKWKKELVVIGVHSAKFDTEKESQNIAQAIERYEIQHPVINDNRFEIWNQYGINAWPSFIILDPEGKVFGKHSGEGVYELFDEIVRGMVQTFQKKGILNSKPISQVEEARKIQQKGSLLFPSKVLISEDGQYLFISDTNHNRVLRVERESGKILNSLGSGKKGFKDGTFSEAEFFHPQGMAYHSNILYIADTENHAIRKADFTTGNIETLAGNGKQAMNFNISGKGKDVELNSPWDIVYHENNLYVAMAGSHQIWKIEITSAKAGPFAGSSRENIFDGKLLQAALAQPSGICQQGENLYFVDSETSSVRKASLHPGGEVNTIVGQGLFEFGDVDGDYMDTRLQHPLGITCDTDKLYITDTYNNKIKIIKPETRVSISLNTKTVAGNKDGPVSVASFDEPSGLNLYQKYLYIADTNNHRIRVIDLETRLVSTYQIQF